MISAALFLPFGVNIMSRNSFVFDDKDVSSQGRLGNNDSVEGISGPVLSGGKFDCFPKGPVADTQPHHPFQISVNDLRSSLNLSRCNSSSGSPAIKPGCFSSLFNLEPGWAGFINSTRETYFTSSLRMPYNIKLISTVEIRSFPSYVKYQSLRDADRPFQTRPRPATGLRTARGDSVRTPQAGKSKRATSNLVAASMV